MGRFLQLCYLEREDFMSNCIYCGNPVGLFKSKHQECIRLFQEGSKKINKLIPEFLKNDEQMEKFQEAINDISYHSYISESKKIDIIRQAILTDFNDIIIKRVFDIKQLKKLFELLGIFDLRNELKDDITFNNLIGFITENISDKISSYISSEESNKIDGIINNVNEELKFDPSFKENILINSLEKYIYISLDSGVITEKEEKAILNFVNRYGIPESKLSENEAYIKGTKSLIIRDILNGIMPHRMHVINQVPFNLQKNETLIWLINNVDYYEDITQREYIGGSQGASIKIAKGVYYRMNSFKGQPVDTVEKIHLGDGILGFTNKSLYFHNSSKSFRIKYDKIISVLPNDDGFTIFKEGVRTKPQIFIDGDGWFSFNVISNLSQIDIN